MGNIKCSAKFLRSHMWAAHSLSEADRTEVVLRLACQKLGLRTKEGCFTDPDITQEYIEKCFGAVLWERVSNELASLADAPADLTVIYPELAFGVSLLDDIKSLEFIFEQNILDVYKSDGSITPSLYKHGTRKASGLRPTYACRSGLRLVIAEYVAYCEHQTLAKELIDSRYVWFMKELERVRTDMSAMPKYTAIVDGVPKEVPEMPTVIFERIALRYTYMSGIYAVLCYLITRRLNPNYKTHLGNNKWDNVWYFGAGVHPVSKELLKSFSTVTPVELLYLHLIQEFTSLRGGFSFRLDYKSDNKGDEKIMQNPEIRKMFKTLLQEKQVRLSGEVMEVFIGDADLRSTLFADGQEAEFKSSLRDAVRTYCYVDYKVNGISSYKATFKCKGDLAPFALKYPTTLLKGVTTFEYTSQDASTYPARPYIYTTDCLDGNILLGIIQEQKPTEPYKLVYVGAGDAPRILVTNKSRAESLRANLKLFKPETGTFGELTDDMFIEETQVAMSGIMGTAMSEAITGESSSYTGPYAERLRGVDKVLAVTLICDALNDDRLLEEAGKHPIRMPNFWLNPPSERQKMPYPFFDSTGSSKAWNAPEGGTLPLGTCGPYPLYIMFADNDAYFGIGAFGGVEIVCDFMTAKPLLLKRTFVSKKLGLTDEQIGHVLELSRIFRPNNTVTLPGATSSIKALPDYQDMLKPVVDKLLAHELVIAPVTGNSLMKYDMGELFTRADRLTWDMKGIWEIKRLTKGPVKEET